METDRARLWVKRGEQVSFSIAVISVRQYDSLQLMRSRHTTVQEH